MSRRLAAVGVFLWVLLGSVLPGQQSPAPASRFRVSSNVILVDVHVRDAAGRPVRGLRAEDFTLLEEGVPQPVGYFQEVDLPLPEVRTAGADLTVPAAAPAPRVDTETPARPVSAVDRRILILFFNTASAGMQDLAAMQEAARQFLARQFTPQDAMAVLVYNNGLQQLTDLTGDRTVLERAIGRLGGINPEMDLSLPDDGTGGGANSGTFLADETEYALFDTNQQLSAIQSVADAYRDVSGRKALIYFSSGMTSRGVENDLEMRQTTDLCNRSNISVYAVDARGLAALPPGGGAMSAGGGGTSIYTGRAGLNQLAALSQSQEGLITLAADTGGTALTDDNDLGKIFRQAQEDSSHYYLLGYQVPEAPRDGRFHKIEVRVRREGARLTYRRGYYSDKPYASLSQSERDYSLLQAVLKDEEAADFALQMAAEYFPAPGGQFQVPVLLAFDYPELSAISGADNLNLDVVLLARDPEGRTRAAVRDRLEIRRGRTGRDARFVYQNLFLLDPGSYRLAAYVRDNRTGRMARGDCSLELPADRAIRTGSLVLAGGWRKPDAESGFTVKRGTEATQALNPLLVSGRVLIPRVGGRFTPDEDMYVHARVWVETPPAGGLRYRLTLLGPERQTLYESESKPVPLDADRTGAVNARLPLAPLAAGRYRLRVELEGAGPEPLTLSREFEIVPPAAPAAGGSGDAAARR